MEQKKYKNGFVLGKFMPLHNGHMLLIVSAAEICENLTVLVCSLEREPIPGKLRYEWVKSFCNSISKNCNIKAIHMTEDLPQLPEEHKDFWDIWCNVIQRSTPDGLDAIFSSEDYGFELAERLDIKHELVDKERLKQPISGTEIRNNPYVNWKYIYPKARPYFMNRVYFLGPESTGKTTTSKLLSEKFETNWVPEYGRILYEKNNGHLDLMDFCEIVVKQREIENNLIQNSADTVIFCDTETITTKIFCELYYPGKSQLLNEFFDYHITKQLENKCHFFVMYPELTEAIQDGTRRFIEDDSRSKHYDKIISELNQWGVKYTILYGNYKDRISSVEEFININNYIYKQEEQL